MKKALLLILICGLGSTAFSQTMLIAHRSHSGTLASFSIDGWENLGLYEPFPHVIDSSFFVVPDSLLQQEQEPKRDDNGKPILPPETADIGIGTPTFDSSLFACILPGQNEPYKCIIPLPESPFIHSLWEPLPLHLDSMLWVSATETDEGKAPQETQFWSMMQPPDKSPPTTPFGLVIVALGLASLWGLKLYRVFRI